MRKKRKGEALEPAAGAEKRAKKGEDPCGKFLSLVAAEDTVIAGGVQLNRSHNFSIACDVCGSQSIDIILRSRISTVSMAGVSSTCFWWS